MSIRITESDKIAYDCSAAKDSFLTLEEFAGNRLQEKIQIAQASRRYEERLKLTKLSLVKSIGKLKWIKNDCVARTIVIDGASVLGNDTSISSLLSITRFFVARRFEVLLVLPKSFQKLHGVPELVNNNICVIVPGNSTLTGTMALEVASQFNGIVVTSGTGSLGDFGLKIEWSKSKYGHLKTETSDYIAKKQFCFKKDCGEEMTEDEVISKVYAFPDQLQYSISKERRDMAYSEEKKAKTLALLDQLIVDGLNKKNVEKDVPRKSPEQAPVEEEEEQDEW